jgi:TolB-like protein
MDLKKFFSELKRRNVYKVAITYAIAAWLILQIGSVVFETIKTPEWVMQVLLFFIVIGFPISLILAWAFEMSPQGIIRTSSLVSSNNPYTPNKKKPLTSKLFIGILLLALIGQFLYNRFNNKELVDTSNVEKSIAVLPFINDSPKEENLYFCNGIQEGVLDHLAKIPELTVISRTSVEQYRQNKPSLKEIAKELGVQYLVEGSVQRIDNQVVIFAQLIYAEEDKHLWSKKYQRELYDVFVVQADVAESIAEQLKALITSDVKEMIEFVPTKNLQAYDYYLKGRDDMAKFLIDKDKIYYNNALENYNKALELDSLMGNVYAEIARMYWLNYSITANKEMSEEMFKIGGLCEKALSINPNLPIAHSLFGISKLINKDFKGFREEQYKALDINPNYALGYYFLGMRPDGTARDYEYRIKTLQKAIVLDPNSIWTPRYYITLSIIYMDLLAFKEAEFYAKKRMDSDPQSKAIMVMIYMRQERYPEAEQLINEIFDYEKGRGLGLMAEIRINYYKNYSGALELMDRVYEINPDIGHADHRRGLLYWLNGDQERGRTYLVNALEEFDNKLKFSGFSNCYDVAGIYATLGDTEKALEILQSDDCIIYNGLEYYFSHDPLFKNIWNDVRFKSIVEDLKYEREIIRDSILKNLSMN